MKDVFDAAIKEIKNNRKFVISTVTRTQGSTPQKPGAKLLVREDGSGVGTLGGGCVEGDIWFASSEKIKREENAEVRPYELNEDLAAKDGLVCGGTMHFMIDPIDDKLEFEFFLDEINKAYNGEKPVALVQVLESENLSEISKKILVREDGSKSGKLISEEIDNKLIKESRDLLALGKNKTLKIENRLFYIEAFTTPPKLLLAGGGHVSKAIANLAKPLGFELNIFDDREDFANPDRLKSLKKAQENKKGTVGVVAIDKNRVITAGTSTGGMTNKAPGRVGDSPIIGAGTWVENNSCGVSATGHGEYFIRFSVAKEICVKARYQNKSIQQASTEVMNQLKEIGADGGVIVMDSQGNYAFAFNTPAMARAYKDASSEVIKIYKN